MKKISLLSRYFNDSATVLC